MTCSAAITMSSAGTTTVFPSTTASTIPSAVRCAVGFIDGPKGSKGEVAKAATGELCDADALEELDDIDEALDRLLVDERSSLPSGGLFRVSTGDRESEPSS